MHLLRWKTTSFQRAHKLPYTRLFSQQREGSLHRTQNNGACHQTAKHTGSPWWSTQTLRRPRSPFKKDISEIFLDGEALRGSSSGEGGAFWLELRGGIHGKEERERESGRKGEGWKYWWVQRSDSKKRTYVLYLGGWVCDVILQPAPGALQAASRAHLFLSLL